MSGSFRRMASAVIAEPASVDLCHEVAWRDCHSSLRGLTPPARLDRCIILLVLLGVGLRGWLYFSDLSVWHDEAALIVNVIAKDFGEQFGALHFAEAAPPLFLTVEKVITLLLGDGPLALRLLPFLASCAAVLLFVVVARRMLTPTAAMLAVLLFSTSEMLGWHACEAKSYAIDVLAAVVLLALHFRPLAPRLAIYALLAPPLIFLAFPACFLFGGVLTALLPEVWQSRQRRVWLLYGLLTVAVFASFAALALGPVRAQRCELMTSDWLTKFPPWRQPWTVPVWVATSSVEIVRYSLKPFGQFLAPLVLVGAWMLWQGRRRRLVVLLLLPIALALAASFLGAYPYGGTRVLAYAIPAVVLLIAASALPTWQWLLARCRPAAALLAVLLAAPVVSGVYCAAVPRERADAAGATAHVLHYLQNTDAVIANDWEFAYYFRQHGDCFHLAMPTPDEPGCRLAPRADWHTPFALQAHQSRANAERIWLIAKAPTAAGRQAYLDALPAGTYHIRERHEFRRVTVVLLERAR